MKTVLPKLAFLFVVSISSLSFGQQSVFLDFDSGTDGSINYTTAMRSSIQSLMTDIFDDFGVTFSLSNPGGEFTTLTYNAGGAGGLADGIDFRNLNKSDNAVINVDGLGFSETDDLVGLSANIGAHEFGHLMGLRHRDSFGPIGSGVIASQASRFLPVYPGPTNADEFGDHVMSTPAFGADINRFTDPVWLSERSAIKLAMIDQGTVINEVAGSKNDIANAQSIAMGKMAVANTIESGDNAALGEFFDVDNAIILGSLDAGDQDLYSFDGLAGDLFNFEVMSSVLGRTSSFDTTISILDSNGALVDYYGSTAFNDDEIETTDSVIIDLFLPSDGTYFVQVAGFNAAQTGDYELAFSRFNGAFAVPEPGAMVVLMMMGAGVLTRRRRG
ncbi:MAG: PEP-CTERM sorting domain-containing protein [Mariniblastus sp.]